jgi:hypothetical protein
VHFGRGAGLAIPPRLKAASELTPRRARRKGLQIEGKETQTQRKENKRERKQNPRIFFPLIETSQ